MGSRCHDPLPNSYGTEKCRVCGKKFELAKWQEDMICIPCEVYHMRHKVQHPCEKCSWMGSVSEMKYSPPRDSESGDVAYYLCPKCEDKIIRKYCGEFDDWDHA